jgi:hypothetical protein
LAYKSQRATTPSFGLWPSLSLQRLDRSPEAQLSSQKKKFSTLEYAEVPNMPTDPFIPMVKQLEGEWDANFGAADLHLFEMVGTTLSFAGPH